MTPTCNRPRADAAHDLLEPAEHHAPEVHCRACGAVFARAGPPPYRTICPYCLADGEIVTLTVVPDREV